MIRVLSDVLTAADKRQVTLLGLLDMSAAFDCVDHSVLVQRLQKRFSLTGHVLQWLTSFLVDRTQVVAYNSTLSQLQWLHFGVPQGSVHGPLLFNLYTVQISEIVASHGHRLHQYADDCQLYLSVPPTDAVSAVDQLSRCISDVAEWLSSNRLRLNPAKTVAMWLGSKQQLDRVRAHNLPVSSTSVPTVDTARDLGVVLDSGLSMSAHVSAVCRSAYCQLRQLRPVVRSLPVDIRTTLIQAFISSRLDYCNALLYGVTDDQLRRLQAVQNAAARLTTGTRRRDHITPVLRQLHWLPVRQRVEFKLAVFMFKAINGLAPAYLSDECQLVTATGRRQLRSSNVHTFVLQRTTTRFGDRAFAAAGPRLWNSLPSNLRQPDISLGQFRRALKTHLFC